MIPFKEIEKLIQALHQTNAEYLRLEKDDNFLELVRTRDGGISERSATHEFKHKVEVKKDEPSNTHDITSPYVGFFQRAKKQGGPPLVKLREVIPKSTCVAYIRSHGTYYEVLSEEEGKVVEVLVENGQVVEYGQPLFRLRLRDNEKGV